MNFSCCFYPCTNASMHPCTHQSSHAPIHVSNYPSIRYSQLYFFTSNLPCIQMLQVRIKHTDDKVHEYFIEHYILLKCVICFFFTIKSLKHSQNDPLYGDKLLGLCFTEIATHSSSKELIGKWQPLYKSRSLGRRDHEKRV